MPKIDADMVKCLGFVSLRSMENVEVDTIDLTLLNLNIERARWKGLIQGIYEFDIFSICFPEYEIRVCLDGKVKGSSISFAAPSNIPNSKIIGPNVCSVFTFSDLEETWDPPPLFTKISNKSKGETWTYGPSYYGIPEDGKHMIRLSHWKFGDELEAGDEEDVCVVVGVGFRVVGCGVKIVYEQEDEHDEAAKGYNAFAGWTTVIGGDLSRKKKKEAYFLCNHRFRILTRPDLYPDDIDQEEIEDGWCKQLFEQSAEATGAHIIA